jgi:hypothetical protein
VVDSRPPDDQASDAALWWRAYVLAENDQVDELRALAAAGDDHAGRQLASWLSDRAFSARLSDLPKLEEAIDVIRPLADAGDDVAELWLARWLADGDHLDELRQRAASGSYHAPRELAKLLAQHDMYDELRELATTADPERRLLILEAAGEGASGSLDVLRVLADLGDKRSRHGLARRLAREGHLDELRQRAISGDEYAQHYLDETLSQS